MDESTIIWKRERERERERIQSWIKEVKVIYLAYDDNFIPTLTLAWLDRLSMVSSARAFLGRFMSAQFFSYNWQAMHQIFLDEWMHLHSIILNTYFQYQYMYWLM